MILTFGNIYVTVDNIRSDRFTGELIIMNVYDINDEHDFQRCELCGIIENTRPYGLNHEEICLDCARKDETVTIMRMKECIYVEDVGQ